jgi:uncharacterized membrane protein (UPF0127 family)
MSFIMSMRRISIAAACLVFVLPAACSRHHENSNSAAPTTGEAQMPVVPVTVQSAGGGHTFQVQLASTQDEQSQGLKGRTDIADDGGMLLAPFPPDGGGQPARGAMWMKDTPTSLDMVFIGADHTIKHIVADTKPNDETLISTGVPVVAVLELKGGQVAANGIKEGDAVSWQTS